MLEAHGDVYAPMIEDLRDVGLDNRMLMITLDELGADPKLLAGIERSAERAHKVAVHMDRVRAELAEAVAAGAMSPADAELQLAETREKLEAEQYARRARVEVDQATRVKLAMVHDEIRAAMEAGEMTPREAEERLKVMHDRLVAEHENVYEERQNTYVELDPVPVEFVGYGVPISEAELHPLIDMDGNVHGGTFVFEYIAEEGAEPRHIAIATQDMDTHLAAAVEEGMLTADAAATLRAQADEHMERQAVELRTYKVRELKGRLEKMREAERAAYVEKVSHDLRAAVEAGKLTEAEAAVKLSEIDRRTERLSVERRRRSVEDRKALREHLRKAQARVELALVEGTMTPEESASEARSPDEGAGGAQAVAGRRARARPRACQGPRARSRRERVAPARARRRSRSRRRSRLGRRHEPHHRSPRRPTARSPRRRCFWSRGGGVGHRSKRRIPRRSGGNRVGGREEKKPHPLRESGFSRWIERAMGSAFRGAAGNRAPRGADGVQRNPCEPQPTKSPSTRRTRPPFPSALPIANRFTVRSLRSVRLTVPGLRNQLHPMEFPQFRHL